MPEKTEPYGSALRGPRYDKRAMIYLRLKDQYGNNFVEEPGATPGFVTNQ